MFPVGDFMRRSGNLIVVMGMFAVVVGVLLGRGPWVGLEIAGVGACLGVAAGFFK